MRIGIFSLSRSGSSALFYGILSAMPEGTEERFEPSPAALLSRPLLTDCLAKIVLDSGDAATPSILAPLFDQSVLLVRDLRDQMVSAALFAAHGSAEPDFSRFLRELTRKRRQPGSISFLKFLEDAFAGWDRTHVESHVRRCVELIESASEIDPSPSLVRYEDFIGGEWNGIEVLRGLKAQSEIRLPEHRAYGRRRVTSGDWKNWFTSEDVEFFRPLLTDYLARFGYPDDWQPAINPRIRDAESTEFVKQARIADREFRRRGLLWGESSR